MAEGPQTVQRIQGNFLAIGERRLLTWICARLPRWVTPDQLTSVGFSGALLILAGYALSILGVHWLWLCIAGHFVQWFGDSLDGSLARFRKIERPQFGYFIDHSTDALANLLAIFGMGLSPFVRLDVALFALAGYLLLSIHAFLAARVVGEMRLSYVGGGPTELHIILIVMTLLMIFVGDIPSGVVGASAYDVFVGAVGLIMVLLFVWQTSVTAKLLSRRGE